jgi:hypothetical protein
MKKDSIKERKSSRITYEILEDVVRNKVQGFIQDILE